MGITLAVDEQGSACDLSTPKALVDASDNEFAASLDLHVQRLSYQYGSAIVSKIWTQRRMLKEEYNTSRSLKNMVDRVSTLHVNEAWSDNDFTRRFADLKTFAIGLASVPPGTHTVESDFSILRRVRNKQRTRLTNFSMEGEMHATQFFLSGIAG
ncbi:hypothetical protein PF011_g17719 [Phytophthora fragariae]|uniref:Uncharacterized protein n=1 Tax=Phytophthora fragariae TaxID=53985 RepID=A0A6A3JA08_9STRA|nr:hypothetical protein PF011_g17719 [Phytophthora fragariae]